MIDKQKRNAYAWRTISGLAVASALLIIVIGIVTNHSQSLCGSLSSSPTDNPIAQRYENYAWTDSFRWSCVYNINDFDSTSDQQRFNQVRDAAVKNGGGVVYLPSGTYTFTDDLILKAGVVIRGDSSLDSNSISEGFKPQTKISFPTYEPKFYGNGTPNDTAFKVIRSTTKKYSD